MVQYMQVSLETFRAANKSETAVREPKRRCCKRSLQRILQLSASEYNQALMIGCALYGTATLPFSHRGPWPSWE